MLFLLYSSCGILRANDAGIQVQWRSRLFQLQRLRFTRLGGRGRQFHEQPRAGVPAEKRIIVVGGTDGFGAFVPGHRLVEPLDRRGRGAEAIALEDGLGAAFSDDSGIIRAVVSVARGGGNFDDECGFLNAMFSKAARHNVRVDAAARIQSSIAG